MTVYVVLVSGSVYPGDPPRVHAIYRTDKNAKRAGQRWKRKHPYGYVRIEEWPIL